MPKIRLTRLNTGYATDPDQNIIAYPVTSEVTALEQTLVDVISGSRYRSSLTPVVSSFDSLSNCTASIVDGELNVTGTSIGAGSLGFTLDDGDGGQSTETLTLNVVASDGTSDITLTDVTATGFDDVLVVNDIITYSTSTTVEGSVVQVNALGRVQITGTYTSGDSFTYQINSGTPQTYTFE